MWVAASAPGTRRRAGCARYLAEPTLLLRRVPGACWPRRSGWAAGERGHSSEKRALMCSPASCDDLYSCAPVAVLWEAVGATAGFLFRGQMHGRVAAVGFPSFGAPGGAHAQHACIRTACTAQYMDGVPWPACIDVAPPHSASSLRRARPSTGLQGERIGLPRPSALSLECAPRRVQFLRVCTGIVAAVWCLVLCGADRSLFPAWASSGRLFAPFFRARFGACMHAWAAVWLGWGVSFAVARAPAP